MIRDLGLLPHLAANAAAWNAATGTKAGDVAKAGQVLETGQVTEPRLWPPPNSLNSVLTTSTFLFLVLMPGAPLVASLLLVAMPFATSSVLAPSSDALCY